MVPGLLLRRRLIDTNVLRRAAVRSSLPRRHRSFWTLFGPYAPDRVGPRGNGPFRPISGLGRCGPPRTARNPLQVLALAREWRFKSSHPHQIKQSVREKTQPNRGISPSSGLLMVWAYKGRVGKATYETGTIFKRARIWYVASFVERDR